VNHRGGRISLSFRQSLDGCRTRRWRRSCDTTPPDTTITAQPSTTTTETVASFSFSASESGSTFACKLDGASWASCSSPKSYSGLSVGTHTFSVRAIDGSGNVDSTPASASWTVQTPPPPAETTPPPDTTPPDTAIIAQPPASTTETAASLSFSASESGSTFACKLDGASWTSCSSPKGYSGLSVGAHAFSVRATDGAGNVDATPASASWTVEAPADTTPPDTTITAQPSANTTETAASLSFASSESGSTFACKLDAGSWASCSSPKGYSGLSVGEHSFSVKATDGVGNVDATPASANWTVEAPADTTPPNTSITSQPSAATTETAASFSFISSESGSAFACKLDAGSWTSCSSPKGYSGLSVGAHTFSVRATDGAGNVDATPASANWTVEAPASPGSHCFSSPHTCGYPDETNTGASGTLTPSGSITVSTNGAVVKDKEVTGKITINASNVTIENVKVIQTATGSGTQAISNNGSGNVIRYVTAAGKGTGSNTIEAAVRGFNGVTLEHDYFYNCNECMQGGGTVKDSYMVVSSIYSGAHAEDIYICSDTINVNHSTLINSVNQTATVFGDTICGGGNKYTVTNSLLAGSGYVFYPQANNTNPAGAQTTITGNHIARCLGAPETKENGHWYCQGGSDSNGIYPFGGSYGIGAYFSGPITWSGNVWDDNLATIPQP